ncbi:MAG TPA: hypothetical protein PLD78_02585, partial [Burkholderiaceae bacterium]|nr:hypothetical protein [Burkholderiaceae bacterium]
WPNRGFPTSSNLSSRKTINIMAKEPRTEAERKASPKPVPMPGYTNPVGHGQKISLERGTWTRSKKNPGKRPHKGG